MFNLAILVWQPAAAAGAASSSGMQQGLGFGGGAPAIAAAAAAAAASPSSVIVIQNRRLFRVRVASFGIDLLERGFRQAGARPSPLAENVSRSINARELVHRDDLKEAILSLTIAPPPGGG